jgi:phospholipid transport system substrate-binding protein
MMHMTLMKSLAMETKGFTFSRRGMSLALAASLTVGTWPSVALAFDVVTARILIEKVVLDVNKIIISGDPEPKLLAAFESLFVRYADVPIIARSALGAASRTASPAQMTAFTKAFQGYISRKYGRRFREFIGGSIEVKDAQPLKSYYEVVSVGILKGSAPFDLRWHVSSRSGQDRFFNLLIEGVNLLSVERVEIGALLDKDKGYLDALIESLKNI